MDNLLNRIHNENCLDLLSKIKSQTIDIVITDPPYLVNYKTNHRKDKYHEFCSEIQSDTMDYKPLIEETMKEAYRILRDDTSIYVFCSASTIDTFKPIIEGAGFNVKNIIIWVKNNHTAGDLKAQYAKRYEMIIYANKGRRLINGERLTDVWHHNRVSWQKQKHQNQKPVDLIEKMLEKSSEPGDIVVDMFGGIGTTAIAAQNTNRNFIVSEIESKYCDIANELLMKNLK